MHSKCWGLATCVGQIGRQMAARSKVYFCNGKTLDPPDPKFYFAKRWISQRLKKQPFFLEIEATEKANWPWNKMLQAFLQSAIVRVRFLYPWIWFLNLSVSRSEVLSSGGNPSKWRQDLTRIRFHQIEAALKIRFHTCRPSIEIWRHAWLIIHKWLIICVSRLQKLVGLQSKLQQGKMSAYF